MSKKSNEQGASEERPVEGGEDAPVNDDDGTEAPEALLAAGADPAQLRVELDLARVAAEDHRDKYLRAVAEVENVRRRAANDVANARKFAVEGFARETLLVRDSLELARDVEVGEAGTEVVAKIKEGLDLTLKQLDAAFDKFGIEVVDPAPGDRLDPDRHQAMTMQESVEIEPNHIVSVVQKGYAIHDRLLRPAMVVVAKAAAGEAEPAPEKT